MSRNCPASKEMPSAALPPSLPGDTGRMKGLPCWTTSIGRFNCSQLRLQSVRCVLVRTLRRHPVNTSPCVFLMIPFISNFPLHPRPYYLLFFNSWPLRRLSPLTFPPLGSGQNPQHLESVGASVRAPCVLCERERVNTTPPPFLDRIVHIFGCLLVSGAALLFPALALFKASSCAVRMCLSLPLLCFLSVRAGPAQHRARVSTDY